MNIHDPISNLQNLLDKYGFLSEYHSWPILYLLFKSLKNLSITNLLEIKWEQIIINDDGNVTINKNRDANDDGKAEEDTMVTGQNPLAKTIGERDVVDLVGRLLLKAVFNQVNDLEKISCPFILTEPMDNGNGTNESSSTKCIFMAQRDCDPRLVSQDLLDLLNDMIIDAKVDDKDDDEGIESDTLSSGKPGGDAKATIGSALGVPTFGRMLSKACENGGKGGGGSNSSTGSCSSGGSSGNLGPTPSPLTTTAYDDNNPEDDEDLVGGTAIAPPKNHALFCGLTMEQVLERCADHLKRYKVGDDSMVNQCKAMCRSLAMGLSSFDNSVIDIMGTLRGLGLSGAHSATYPEYTNENLTENKWDDVMEEIKTGNVTLKAVTPGRSNSFDLTTPVHRDRNHLKVNGGGYCQSYGDIAHEIKINFPTLRKTPSRTLKDPDSKEPPVTTHEKLMCEIQHGVRLNQVITVGSRKNAHRLADRPTPIPLPPPSHTESSRSSILFNNPWMYTHNNNNNNNNNNSSNTSPRKTINQGGNQFNYPLSPFVPFYYCDNSNPTPCTEVSGLCRERRLTLNENLHYYNVANTTDCANNCDDSLALNVPAIGDKQNLLAAKEIALFSNDSLKRQSLCATSTIGRSPYLYKRRQVGSQELNVEKNPNLLEFNGRRSPNLKTKARSFRMNPQTCKNRSLKSAEKKWISLSFKEFCHIRRALFSAELETYYVNNLSMYKNFTCKKVCSACQKTRWSIFGQQGVKCHICTRILCISCHEKISLSKEHFSNIPTSSLIPQQLSVERCENFFKIPYDESNKIHLYSGSFVKGTNSQNYSNHPNASTTTTTNKMYQPEENLDNNNNSNNNSKTSFTTSLYSNGRGSEYYSDSLSDPSETSSNQDTNLKGKEAKISLAQEPDRSMGSESLNTSQSSKSDNASVTSQPQNFPTNDIFVCKDCAAILKRSMILSKLKRVDTRSQGNGTGGLRRNASHLIQLNRSIASRS